MKRPRYRDNRSYLLLAIIVIVFWCLIWTTLVHASEDTIAIQTIMMEAGGESHKGMVAVGEVIRNRAKDPRFAFKGVLTHESVCLAKSQFSCWNDRQAAKKWLRKYGTGELYQKASKAWHESESTNIVKGANHYYAIWIRQPNWAVGKPQQKLGTHVFVRR